MYDMKFQAQDQNSITTLTSNIYALVIVVPHKGLTGVFLYNVFKIQRHDEF
jgi:hypothetical protein